MTVACTVSIQMRECPAVAGAWNQVPVMMIACTSSRLLSPGKMVRDNAAYMSSRSLARMSASPMEAEAAARMARKSTGLWLRVWANELVVTKNGK